MTRQKKSETKDTENQGEIIMFKSLKLKLIVIIAVLCTVSLLIQSYSTLRSVEKSTGNLLNESYNIRTEYFASQINGWLIDGTATVKAVETTVINSEVGGSTDSIVKALTDCTENDKLAAMVYVQMADGMFLNGSGWVPPEDFDGRTRVWYGMAVDAKGELCYSSPYVDASTGDLIVTVSKYFNKNGWEGVAALDVYIDTLLSDIQQLAQQSGEEGSYVFVTGADDSMIYHPNQEFRSTVDKILTVNDLGIDYVGASSSDDAAAIKDYDGTPVYVTQKTIPAVDWHVFCVSPARNFDHVVGNIRNQMTLIFIICLVIALVVAAVAGFMVAAPITEASGKIKRLSEDVKEGRADLSANIRTSARDELGQLVQAVNDLKNAMGDIIKNVTVASEELTRSAKSLNGAAARTSDNVSTISAAMEEMSASSEETSASTSIVTQQVNDITGLTERVSRNAAEKTGQISDSLTNIDVRKSEIETNDENMMARLNAAIEKLQERITDTKKVEEIRAMTQGISDVATQTNLLSLNAAIEAARAGEAGRGFAVVADEIGNLANNSANMAGNIQEVSDEVLAIVEQLVRAAEEVAEIMLQISKENSEEKKVLIDEYIRTLNECYTAMSAISADNQEIAVGISKIKDSISSIDTAVEENAHGVTSVAEGAGELVSASDEVLGDAGSIERVSSELMDRVGGFIY